MSSRNRAEGSNDNGEEGIKVAIRMRPLNTKETKASRVWRVLQKYNSVTQTTGEGKPLPERITGRTFFTFDKTFGEKTTTREVYNDVAQGIVESVVNGLNGTIFAYGQTASGKTHTMQGSGTIEDGQGTGGGVVHMAARDVFSQISNDPQRVFLLRVSFIEIYMEEVRDLLVSGDNKVLQIREDSARGVFVNATENIVTDFQTLLSTLFAGEKHRAFASTEMNERSSRSHTIFRITVESRKRKEKDTDTDNSSDDDASASSISDDYDDDDGDGAVRISTLNLVDLAGSESVKHTGATGDRLKEGAKINQSLLTLSRVIAALGSPSRTHINFRDSKLTRILQPSLSGNARMAIICCATPSEMYLEETRSTLQFASRAKLVKTRATVNEVLDERSMIKKLQRELAVAKRAADGEIDMSQIRELESEAARAENVAKTVQEKYEKLKASILKGGMFQDSVIVKNRKRISSIRTPAKDTILNITSPSLHGMDRKRRRQSDGIVHHYNPVSSPLLDVTNRNVALATLTPTVERKAKSNAEETAYLQDSGSFQIVLLKEALSAKGDITRDMNRRLNEWEEEAERYGASLNSAQSEINTLKEDHSSSIAQVELLSAEKEALELQRQDIVDELNEKSVEKDTAINKALATIESMLMEKEQLEGNIESLEDQNEKQDATMSQMKTDFDAVKEQCDVLQDKCAVNDAIIEKNDSDITEHIRSNAKLLVNLVEAREFNVASVQTNEALQGQIRDLTFTVNNLNSDIINGGAVAHTIQEQKELAESLANQMSDKEDSALSENQCLIKQNSELDDQLQSLVLITAELKNELVMKNSDMEVLTEEKDLAETLSSQMSKAEDSALTQFREIQRRLQEMEVELAQKESKLGELSESKTIVDDNLEQAKADNKSICHQKSELDDQLQSLVLITAELKNELVMKNSEMEVLMEEKDLAETLSSQMSKAEDSALTQFREIQRRLQEMEVELAQKESKLGELSESKTIVDENLEQANADNKSICHQKSELDDQLQSLVLITAELKNELVMKNSEIEVLTEEKDLAETLSSQMSRAEDSALTQFREIQGRLQEMEVELAQKESKLGELSESKTIVDENLEQSRSERVTIFASNNSLKEKEILLSDTVANLKNDLARSSEVVDTLLKEKELSEALASQMSEAEDAALLQAQELVEHVHKLHSEVVEKSQMNMELLNAKETLAKDVHQLSILLDESKVENKELTETKDLLTEKLEQLAIETSSLNDALSNGDTAAENLVSEKKRIQDLLNDMTEAKHVASTEMEDIRKMLVQAESTTEEAHSELEELNICKLSIQQTLFEAKYQIEGLIHQNDELNKEVTNLRSTRSRLEEDAAAKEFVFETLTREKDLAEAVASQISQMEDCGIQNIHELSKELNVNIHNCMELRAENEKLMTSRDQDQVLAKKLHLAEERINSTEISLNEQYKLVETLQEDNRALSINLENQELKLDASLTVKNANNANTEIHADMMKAQEAEIENYAEEILNLEDALKKCESTLSNMSVKYDIEAQKLTDANRELQLTQSELYQSRNSTEPSTKKDDQSEQIQELQQLLASANAREEEIKKFALATDEELEHKEEEYEEAVLYATECESAAKEWEQKYRSLDAHEPAASGQNTEQILNEMELLLDEKVELEKRLETALSDCDILENDLKKKYEHEQTELLQEADAKMKCIREEVTLRENELEKHKRDARITREELVAIQDQLKSDQSAAIDADEKVLQLTEQFSSAEETSTQLAIELESVKDEYNSFKDHVRSSKESSKLGAERKLTSAKEELALLRETLHGETLKARSCEKDVEVYEKDIVRLQAEMSSTKQSLINEKDYAVSKLKEEIALAKVELSRAQADIFSLNQDVDHYKATVKKTKNENKSNEDTIKYHELLKMNEESRQNKNAEIQEYTKALVSCQDDAEELKKSVKELKSKIKSKDERITNLEAKRLTKEHVAMIKKLKVERRSYKEDAEDLRRKMEESASQMINSNDKENHNYKNFESDFVKVQAKNEALEKKLRKYIAHSDCLTKEMGAIQEMIKETVADSNFEQINNKDLSAAVVGLCERYHTLEEECNALSDAKLCLQKTLTQTKDNLREVAKEKVEINEDLRSTKEEVVTLSKRQKQFQEISENVKGSAKDLEDEKNRQVSYLEKENLHILEENKKLKKQVRTFKTQTKATSLTIQDEPTEDLGSILSTLASQDKENIVNGSIKSPYSAAANTLSKSRVGLGSGEGEIDEDNTQECQQS